MAFAGVGVDIVDIAQMERVLERTPAFKVRVFTEEERLACETTSRPAAHYAARFAAREAVLKALGCGFAGCARPSDVSVSADAKGRPRAVLVGRVADLAAEQGVQEVALSLSFNHDSAIANAVAVTAEARPKQDRAADAKAELAKTFKQARGILAELDEATELAAQRAASGSSGQAAASAPQAAALENAPAAEGA